MPNLTGGGGGGGGGRVYFKEDKGLLCPPMDLVCPPSGFGSFSTKLKFIRSKKNYINILSKFVLIINFP